MTNTPPHSNQAQWQFTPLGLPGIILIESPRFGDTRGWFSETYSTRVFNAHNIELRFVQDNTSFSAEIGTVRGLHYQTSPFAQDKLVRVVSGRILDVAVDIRRNSPTFGQHVAIELDAERGQQLLIPAGYAHGFVTREPNTLVTYKVTSSYAPDHDYGLFWADPHLAINWGITVADAVLSRKDKALPLFKDAKLGAI